MQSLIYWRANVTAGKIERQSFWAADRSFLVTSLYFRNVLINRAHDGFEPPFSAASGAMAARVESTGNCAQAVAAQSQFANCGESRLLGRVRLDMDAIDRQSITELNISDALSFASLMP